MENIQSYIIFDNIIKKSPFNIIDIANIRLVNKDFKKEIININFLKNAIKQNYPILYQYSLNICKIDFIDTILKTDINIVKLEKMLNNWKIIQTRKYGRKYSHLLKNDFLKISLQTDDDAILNTLNIFKCLYKYAQYHMNIQQHAKTDLCKYVLFWVSDYCKLMFIKKNPSINLHGINFINIFKDIPQHKLFENSWNLYKLFETIIAVHNKNVDFQNNLYDDTFNKLLDGTGLYLYIFEKYNLYPIKDYMIFYILKYIKTSLICIGKDNIDKNNEFYITIKHKVLEFINDIPNDTPCLVLQELRTLSIDIKNFCDTT